MYQKYSTTIFNSEQVEGTNHAWIAGPVVGGVFGISIIALGGFLLWRRKRNKRRLIELESRGPPGEKVELEALKSFTQLAQGQHIRMSHRSFQQPDDMPDMLDISREV